MLIRVGGVESEGCGLRLWSRRLMRRVRRRSDVSPSGVYGVG